MSKSEQRRIDTLTKADIDEARDNFIQDCGLTLRTSSADVMAQAWDACALFMQSKMQKDLEEYRHAIAEVIRNSSDIMAKKVCSRALAKVEGIND